MTDMLTTTDAALLLAERGITATPKKIMRWCLEGKIPGALPPTHPRRGQWLIPREALDAFTPPQRGRRITRPLAVVEKRRARRLTLLEAVIERGLLEADKEE